MEVLNESMPLATAAKRYLAFNRSTKAKSKFTLVKEEASLRRWVDALREIPLRQITLDHLREHAQERAEEGVCNRTINLDVLMLGNLLRWTLTRENSVTPVVTTRWKPLKHTTPVRSLMPEGTLEKLCAEAMRKLPEGDAVYPNGQFLNDYLRLLAYSGARKTSALTAVWSNVDLAGRRLTLVSKFDKTIRVDMGKQLFEHLTDMFSRRDVESDYLFPGKTYANRRSVSNLFSQVCAAAGVTGICLHDFRHFFASMCVMQGIDLLTIASWLGHSDVSLISRVYGHLSNPHRVSMAAKLSL